MDEELQPISIAAEARMSSARLSLQDLQFFAEAIEGVRRVSITWSSREIYSVTAPNFSAQSPSIKVVRTFRVTSVEEFAARAPRGKIYIMEARFESSIGTAVLTLGKEGDLSRDLLLSFRGTAEGVPPWFDKIVKKIVSARLLSAGQRETYLLGLTWAPVVLPPVAVPWLFASGLLSFEQFIAAGLIWFLYAVWAPTIARFIRASSLRVTPLFTSLRRSKTSNLPPPQNPASSRIREFRSEAIVALNSGWQTFRRSDHQFNAVLIAILALIVSLATLVVEVSK